MYTITSQIFAIIEAIIDHTTQAENNEKMLNLAYIYYQCDKKVKFA